MRLSRMRGWAVGGACLGALLGASGCGGSDAETTDPSAGFPYREMALAAEAAGIDPNGIGQAPSGPNGLGRPVQGGAANGVGSTPSRTGAPQTGGAAENGDGSDNGSAGSGSNVFGGAASGDGRGDSGEASGAGASGPAGAGIPNGIGSAPTEPTGVGAAPGASGGGGFTGGTIDCGSFCAYVFQCAGRFGGTPDPEDQADCNSECGAAGGRIPTDLDEKQQAIIQCILEAFGQSSCDSLIACVRDSAGGGVDVQEGGGDEPVATPAEPEQPSGGNCEAACSRLVDCHITTAEQCAPACASAPAATLGCVVDAAECQDVIQCFQGG